MAGPDAVRGITFQHACAINAAVDMLTETRARSLTVEGTEDAIDMAVLNADGTSHVIQSRSRAEPYTWSASELYSAILDWAKTAQLGDEFTFMTNGRVNRRAADMAVKPLERARDGTASEADVAVFEQHGFAGPTLSALSRVTLRTDHPDSADLLNASELRILQLRELTDPITTDQATATVDRLFRTIATIGGRRQPRQRTLTREDFAELVGVDVETLDAVVPWTNSLADAYRQRLIADTSSALHIVELLLEPAASERLLVAIGLTKEAPGDQSSSEPLPATAVLAEPEGACLVGPAGAGKTQTAELLSHASARAGKLPIHVPVAVYRPGRLRALVLGVVEQVLGRRLSAAAGAAILEGGDAVVFIDGYSELPPQLRRELARELMESRGSASSFSIIATGRDSFALRDFPLTLYSLRGMTRDQRKEIVAHYSPDSSADIDRILARIERALGHLVSNPLFFSMMLGLHLGGQEPTSRAEAYAAWVDALLVRDKRDPDTERSYLAALAGACAVLVRSERTTAPRDSWLLALREALDNTRVKGIFDVRDVTAEQVFERTRAVGLLNRDAATGHFQLLHDSFRDYLCATAMSRRDVDFPATLTSGWEDALSFLVEVSGFTDAIADYLVGQANLPAVRLAGKDDRKPTRESVMAGNEFFRALVTGRAQKPAIRALREQLPKGLYVVPGESWLYVAIIDEDDVRGLGDRAGLQRHAFGGRIVFAVPADRGPLAIAAEAWLVVLREILRQLPDDPPTSIPPTRDGFVFWMEAFYELRQALMGWFLDVLPEFKDHLSDGAKHRGINAFIVPTESGDDCVYWTSDVDTIEVRLADEPPDDTTYASAPLASFFSSSALSGLRGEIAELLPGLGPRWTRAL